MPPCEESKVLRDLFLPERQVLQEGAVDLEQSDKASPKILS